MRGKIVFGGLLAAMALAGGLWLGQLYMDRRTAEPLDIAGILLPQPKELTDFTLVDQTGELFDRDRFRGQWTFIYFGYTYCPDVCPMTLVELNEVQQQLQHQELDDDVAYMLVSVDPQRDTPERLGEYTRYFNPKFQGATGTPEELTRLTRQLGVFFERSPGQEDKVNYTVDHSSTVILLDPETRLHAVFTPPHEPQALAEDFAKIRERYRRLHG